MVLVKLYSIVVYASVFLGLVRCAQQRNKPVYSNEFAVHIPEGSEAADRIAAKHGFVNRGQVSKRKHNEIVKLVNCLTACQYH